MVIKALRSCAINVRNCCQRVKGLFHTGYGNCILFSVMLQRSKHTFTTSYTVDKNWNKPINICIKSINTGCVWNITLLALASVPYDPQIIFMYLLCLFCYLKKHIENRRKKKLNRKRTIKYQQKNNILKGSFALVMVFPDAFRKTCSWLLYLQFHWAATRKCSISPLFLNSSIVADFGSMHSHSQFIIKSG